MRNLVEVQRKSFWRAKPREKKDNRVSTFLMAIFATHIFDLGQQPQVLS